MEAARERARVEKMSTKARITAGTMGWFITVLWKRTRARLLFSDVKSQKPLICSLGALSPMGSHFCSRSGMFSLIQSSSTIWPRDEMGRSRLEPWVNCFHLGALSLTGVPRVTGAPSRTWSNLRPGTFDFGVGQKLWVAWRTVVGVLGRRKEVASASSSSSADWTQGGSERTARWRSLFSALAVRLRFEDARVRGVLEMEYDWLFRAGPPSWLSLETPETALMRDWGRWKECGCECSDEDEGGGMGEGSSLFGCAGAGVGVGVVEAAEDEDEVMAGALEEAFGLETWALPWAAATSGRSKAAASVRPTGSMSLLSVLVGSPMGVLVMLVGGCEGRPRRTSGSLEQGARP